MSDGVTITDELVARIGVIDPAYRHHEREVRPGEPLVTSDAVLKWYGVFHEDEPVAAALEQGARDFVKREVQRGGIPVQHGVGFVVLHHSTVLDYLIISTFYQTQELWQQVYVRGVDEPGAFRPVQPGLNWSSFCVWELAPIQAERSAWNRYLYSGRDAAARRAYIGDTYSGSTGDV